MSAVLDSIRIACEGLPKLVYTPSGNVIPDLNCAAYLVFTGLVSTTTVLSLKHGSKALSNIANCIGAETTSIVNGVVKKLSHSIQERLNIEGSTGRADAMTQKVSTWIEAGKSDRFVSAAVSAALSLKEPLSGMVLLKKHFAWDAIAAEAGKTHYPHTKAAARYSETLMALLKADDALQARQNYHYSFDAHLAAKKDLSPEYIAVLNILKELDRKIGMPVVVQGTESKRGSKRAIAQKRSCGERPSSKCFGTKP